MPIDRQNFGFHIDGFLSHIFSSMGIDEQNGDKPPIIKDKAKTLRALNATIKMLHRQQLTTLELNQLQKDDTWDGTVNELQKLIKGQMKFKASGKEATPEEFKGYLLEKINEKIALVQSQQATPSSFFANLFTQNKPTPDQKYDSFLKSNKEQLDQSFAFFKKDYGLLYDKTKTHSNEELIKLFGDQGAFKNAPSQPEQSQIKDEIKLRQEFDKRVKEFVTTPSKPNQTFIWKPENGQEGDPLDFSFDLVSTSNERGGIFLTKAREKFLEENKISSNSLPSLPSLPSFDLEKIFNPQKTIEYVLNSVPKFLPPFSQSPKVDFLWAQLTTFLAPPKIEAISSSTPETDNFWKNNESFGSGVMDGFKFNSSQNQSAPEKIEVASDTTREHQNHLRSAMLKAKQARDCKINSKNDPKKRVPNPTPSTSPQSPPTPLSSPLNPPPITIGLVRERIAYFGGGGNLMDHAKKTIDDHNFEPVLSKKQRAILREIRKKEREGAEIGRSMRRGSSGRNAER